MGIPFNAAGIAVPLRERRELTVSLAALNATADLDLNGDTSALVYVNGSGATLTGTLSFLGTVDGTNYFPVLAVPYYGLNGTLPVMGQPLLSEAVSTTSWARVYAIRVGQLKRLRVLMSACTAGAAAVTIVSDANQSIHPAVFEGRPSTLLVTATAALATAVTASLPAVTGLRHYIDFISVVKFNGAVLTAAAAPVVCTTTNLPGSPVLNFPADAATQGTDVERRLDWGGTGCAASAIGTATTIVCPVTTGALWRINVGYRLGL